MSRVAQTIIPLDAACRWTNQSSQAHASIGDFFAGTVGCWDVVRDLGGPDFNGYCRSLGFPGATNNENTAYGWQHTAYGWGCLNDSTAIRVDTTCQWQFANPNITAIFSNFYDATSWQCWG